MAEKEAEKILIIDDDSCVASLMEAKLTSGGFAVSHALTGEAGMAVLRDNKFDLVLLDLNLPGASGIGVLKYIRQGSNQFELPVLMVTASEDPKDLQDALSAGANDYIPKSATWTVKLARIRTQVRLKKLHLETSKLRELAAIDALIVTYNHEINNPLTSALGGLHRLEREESLKDSHTTQIIADSLDRIGVVVKKIENVLETRIEYEEYTNNTKMVKI